MASARLAFIDDDVKDTPEIKKHHKFDLPMLPPLGANVYNFLIFRQRETLRYVLVWVLLTIR
jgi:hypothetical protein